MVLAQNQNIDQWNMIENPKINPSTQGHFTFDKGGKNIQWRQDSFFTVSGAGKTGQLHVKK